MGMYDTIMLVIVGMAAFWGWRKGMVSQIGTIVAVAASSFAAMAFRDQLAVHINAEPGLAQLAAGIILFVGTSLVVWLIFGRIRSSVERLKLRDFDYQMGALLGAISGAILVAILTLISVSVGSWFPPLSDAVARSRSSVAVSKVANTALPYLPEVVVRAAQSSIETLDLAIAQVSAEYPIQGVPGIPESGIPWPEYSPQPGNPVQPGYVDQPALPPPLGYGTQPDGQPTNPAYPIPYPQNGGGVYDVAPQPEYRPPGYYDNNSDQSWRANTESAQPR